MKASRSESAMNAPYSPLSAHLSRMVNMYASKSFRFASVSMISAISACIALSLSISCCSITWLRPGMLLATTGMSVFLVRLFFWTTSIHSYFFSSFLASFLSPSSSFFSPSPSPSALASAASSLGASASLASASSAGTSISRFSLTVSSYSSSSTSCALSIVNMELRLSLAFTLIFLASLCAGRSILYEPSSFLVPGMRQVSSAYSALISKGPFR
mmetsp:Transcript_67516/g.191350  ORF Transcript_67516/g.191350 Transcript_67516/m.191350 type:complete len:215 (-) Transcript_67516:1418-2062(-)